MSSARRAAGDVGPPPVPCRAQERTAGVAPRRAAPLGGQPGAEQGGGSGGRGHFSG